MESLWSIGCCSPSSPSLGTVELLTEPSCCSSGAPSCGFSVSWLRGAFPAAFLRGSLLEQPFRLVAFSRFLVFLRLQALPWVLASPLGLPATLPHSLEFRLTGAFSQFLSFSLSFGSIERCLSSGSRRVAVELLEEPFCGFFWGSFHEFSTSCSRGCLPLVCLGPPTS